MNALVVTIKREQLRARWKSKAYRHMRPTLLVGISRLHQSEQKLLQASRRK
jgi:hypothetical protein